MSHSIILNSRIYFVFGISVLKLFELMDINTIPTFKQILNYKTINTDEK